MRPQYATEQHIAVAARWTNDLSDESAAYSPRHSHSDLFDVAPKERRRELGSVARAVPRIGPGEILLDGSHAFKGWVASVEPGIKNRNCHAGPREWRSIGADRGNSP